MTAFATRRAASQSSSYSVEEHLHGDTTWVAIRARGADWSWLTAEEAACLGRDWVAKYGGNKPPASGRMLDYRRSS
ncbi:MAG TPA: hypothetical protein VGC09_08215 [Rhodopila sp.]